MKLSQFFCHYFAAGETFCCPTRGIRKMLSVLSLTVALMKRVGLCHSPCRAYHYTPQQKRPGIRYLLLNNSGAKGQCAWNSIRAQSEDTRATMITPAFSLGMLKGNVFCTGTVEQTQNDQAHLVVLYDFPYRLLIFALGGNFCMFSCDNP